ncbi:hypothetical protein [uncultured Roseovarius sp.]|uniref:hypothetical protein n=1 Tax=uncultured Roseovarius sp. TaxID=293344 RepID=UPI0026279E8E|nr:hypothetical protein [uncultured Roseovarius sp.]
MLNVAPLSLAPGIGVLYDEVHDNATPASNATHALIHEVIAKADRLARDLDALDRHMKRIVGSHLLETALDP